MWVFVFYVIQLLLVIYTQQNVRCINKPMLKHQQNLDRILDLNP